MDVTTYRKCKSVNTNILSLMDDFSVKFGYNMKYMIININNSTINKESWIISFLLVDLLNLLVEMCHTLSVIGYIFLLLYWFIQGIPTIFYALLIWHQNITILLLAVTYYGKKVKLLLCVQVVLNETTLENFCMFLFVYQRCFWTVT